MSSQLHLLFADQVVDGTGAKPVANGFIAVEGNRIIEIGPRPAATPERYPAVVPRREFPGCTICPGLCDGHVHLTFSAGAVPLDDILHDSDSAQLLRATANARAALQAGVTTLRDLGARGQIIHELRDAVDKGIVPGPRILSSGAPITCLGGHLHFLGGVVEGGDGVSKMAEERIEEGADVIKIIATGGNMTQSSNPLKAQFTTREMAAAVDVANANGLKVTVHARGVEGIRAAVRAGVHGVEHARMEVPPGVWEFDDELAREMADRGVSAAPTFAASFRAFQCQAAGAKVGLRPGAIPIEVRQRNASRLRECGVKVIAGTDAGASMARFEEAMNVEMECLVGAGWTPHEALEAATLGSAAGIGRDREAGSLEPGKFADMVVVRGDPTQDITAMRQVECVFLGGKMVVGGGQVKLDARPDPWPADEVSERPSLLCVFD